MKYLLKMREYFMNSLDKIEKLDNENKHVNGSVLESKVTVSDQILKIDKAINEHKSIDMQKEINKQISR